MTTITGLHIGLDGRLEDITLPAESAELATALNTTLDSRAFDLVRFDDDLDLFVDDEGMYASEPNPLMSALTQRLGYEQPLLFGPGVFLRSDPRTGDSLSLTERQHRRVTDTYRTVLRSRPVIVVSLRGRP